MRLRTLTAWALPCFGLYVVGMALSGFLVSGFMKVAIQLNYPEFGLIKRGLFGTILHGLNRPFFGHADPATIAIGYGLLIGFLFSLGCSMVLERCRHPALIAAFVLSPATLLQFGYAFSWFDGTCALIVLIQIVVLFRAQALSEYIKTLLIGGLAIVAILVHELYVIAFLPLLMVVAWSKMRSRHALVVLLMAALATAAMALFGRYEAGPAALAHQLGIPLQNSPLEFTTPLAENLSGTFSSLWLSGLWRGSIPGLLYLAWITAVVLSENWQRRRSQWLILTALSPLALSLVGVDLPRWTALAGFNILLLALVGELSFPSRLSRCNGVLMLGFFLSGPIGIFWLSFPVIMSRLHPILSQVL